MYSIIGYTDANKKIPHYIEKMKIEHFKTPHGKRYLLLDDDYTPIEEVKIFLKYREINYSPNSLYSYALDLKHYYSYCRLHSIDPITLWDNKVPGPLEIISNFAASFSIDHSESSLKRVISTIIAFYDFLSANNTISEVYREKKKNKSFHSLLEELCKTKLTKKSLLPVSQKAAAPNYISREQFNLLLSLIKSIRNRLILCLLYECGLRLGELLGILMEDLADIEEGILHVRFRDDNDNEARVKRKASGDVYLPEYIVDMLIQYLVGERSRIESEYLFVKLSGCNYGKALDAKNVEKSFLRLSKKANIHIHPHMLRHGFAHEKRDAGWSLYEIQSYLRHANPSSTQIYTAFSDEEKIAKMIEFERNNLYVPRQ